MTAKAAKVAKADISAKAARAAIPGKANQLVL